uniref:CGG triplet repeat-binding protein 1 n=1 Tax=Erpetoichthys calabaricus TaxID=27687 RepID=A0A8C4THF3_ERPCA
THRTPDEAPPQRNKTAVNIGPEQRVKEFGQDKFYAEGGLLWCKTCNEPVDHVRRQTITDHLGTKKHTKRASKQQHEAMNDPTSSKRESTITGCTERSTAAIAAKDTLVMELVEAFMAANIPLEKVDNPTMRSFMQKNLKGGGGIPQANTFRELYLKRQSCRQLQSSQDGTLGSRLCCITLSIKTIISHSLLLKSNTVELQSS